MGILRDVSAGAARATGMMDKLGIERNEVLGEDPGTAGRQLRQRAIGCAVCKGRTDCEHLLATSDSLETAPDYCPNKAELDALARK